jgi:transposase InsO family protein
MAEALLDPALHGHPPSVHAAASAVTCSVVLKAMAAPDMARCTAFTNCSNLKQQFKVDQPNQAWVTDITHIPTLEGWLYLDVLIDLFSRQAIGWPMGHRIDTELILNALLMALWRRKP